ncbi:MAG: hypothetical protein UX21_C0028G0006 [Microgenomates group bacterium GW2011_GWC2_45_8]|nr:MAG: hypothetical protein UX21_C0028G0006 [Microgenomates group bacterium GW2011_GWC2_45_8]
MAGGYKALPFFAQVEIIYDFTFSSQPRFA